MSILNKNSVANAASPHTADVIENNTNKRKSLIKMGAVTVFAGIVVVFMTMHM